MHKYAREAYNTGIRFIGGCCGFEPYHIRALSEELAPERGFLPAGSDKHGNWGAGLEMHTKPWVRARSEETSVQNYATFTENAAKILTFLELIVLSVMSFHAFLSYSEPVVTTGRPWSQPLVGPCAPPCLLQIAGVSQRVTLSSCSRKRQPQRNNLSSCLTAQRATKSALLQTMQHSPIKQKVWTGMVRWFCPTVVYPLQLSTITSGANLQGCDLNEATVSSRLIVGVGPCFSWTSFLKE